MANLMDKKIEKRLVYQGVFEDVIEIDKHYYLVNKKDRICVLPYTMSTNGLLDKIGVIKDLNYIEEEETLTLLNDYVSEDDQTDLVAANRVLFEVLGTNATSADDWMYLGSLYNNMSSDSLIKVYAVDISNTEIKADEDVEELSQRKKFKLLDSARVIQSDDMLFLASYLRLFNYFYVNSLKQKENE
jgi:hypothetical protein